MAGQLWLSTGRVPIDELPREGYYWPLAKIKGQQQRIESGEIANVAVLHEACGASDGCFATPIVADHEPLT